MYGVEQSICEKVSKRLLETVKSELASRMSDKQTDRVVNRRAVDLMMRGMPREQIEQQLEQLRHGAKDEAVRELKLFFILQKIATDRNVDVDESELNGRIAMLAAQRGQRPEKLRQTMAKDQIIRASKGFDDILPADTWRWQAVEQIARTTATLFHFDEIRPPLVESHELFHRGVGETTDIVMKETFNIATRSEEKGQLT